MKRGAQKSLVCYCGHPAQYHFLKYTMRNLKEAGWQVVVLIKTKDISRLKSIVYGSIIIFLINLWYLIPQIYEFLFVDFVQYLVCL